MSTEIDRIVERFFPEGLVGADEFSDWCSLIRQDVMPYAIDLVTQLDQMMEATLPACRDRCHPRSKCWERFGGEGDGLIKSIASIRSKLARDMMSLGAADPRHTCEELRDRILAFGDLGRVRLVGDFPSDALCLTERLINKGLFLSSYSCPKGVKDFVFDPAMRDGLKGHRARQFSVRVPVEAGVDFGFEVQIMTRLQHAWDRRNHPLYEWQREHPKWKDTEEAMRLAVNDFACAEALHLVDSQADQNWNDLQKLMKKEHVI